MIEKLSPGDIIITSLQKQQCKIDQLIGSGGQGEVYKATINQKSFALKIYHDQNTANQMQNLTNIIEKNLGHLKRFVWPLDLFKHKSRCGYLMDLIPGNFGQATGLLNRKLEPGFKQICLAGVNLTDSFHDLHLEGMAYQDISFSNVFIDQKSGEIKIADNDNVIEAGKTGRSQILGTPRFMAPEISCGNAFPSTDTDRYSLAVLLFYFFFISHPLEGTREASIKNMTQADMTRLYGTNPLFIFDPLDDSNRPDKDIHKNALLYWAVYPNFIKKLFIQAFTEGLKKPLARVRESQWRDAFVRLKNSISYCVYCRAENFKDDTKPVSCWNCGHELGKTLKITFKAGESIVLNFNTELYPNDLDETRSYDFSKPLACIRQDIKNPKIWGIKNCGAVDWSFTTKNGQSGIIKPNTIQAIHTGMEIRFGSKTGKISYD